MKILILGGGGFLGSAICDCLLDSGYSVRVFERDRVMPYRDFQQSEQVEWMTGDFLSSHDVEGAMDGVDAIIHLVSTTLPKSSNDDPLYDIQSNLVSTLQVLEAMKKKEIRKIIYASSGGTIYGIPKTIPITESHPTEPICSYGITKLTIEKYLKLYKTLHGIHPVILRLANPYGPRQRIETAQGAVAVFLYNAFTNNTIKIWGDGSVVRDYLFVDDVAAAFRAALNYEGDKTTFNIGSGYGTSLNQLIIKIEKLFNIRLNREYAAARSFDVPCNTLCIVKSKDELGWTPTTAIEEGLSKTIEWLKQQ
jgi:UDP-glucose 4-epimerase